VPKHTVDNYVARIKPKNGRMVSAAGFVDVNSALDRSVIRYIRRNIEKHTNHHNFLDRIKPELIEKLREHALTNPIKYHLKLEATFNLPSVDRSAENGSLKSPAKPVFRGADIAAHVVRDFSALLAEEDDYMGRGNGFTLSCIDGL